MLPHPGEKMSACDFLRSKVQKTDSFYQWMSTKRGLPSLRINRQGLPQPWNPLCLMTATERRLHQAWQDKLAKYKETREITADSVFLLNLSQTEKFQPKKCASGGLASFDAQCSLLPVSWCSLRRAFSPPI